VLLILGALGFELPEPNGLDLRGHADATGQMREFESSSE
jgi:hypothetical protein